MNPQSPTTVTESTTTDQIDNITSGTWKYIRAHGLPYILISLLFSALVFYFDHQIGGITAFVLTVLGYSLVSAKIKTEFTKQFGQSIGFSYVKNIGLETVSGKLFKTGHSQSLFDCLVGAYQNIPLRIFTFRFTIGSGKDSHTYSYTVFEATLVGTVPDILLFSNAHMTAVSDWFSGNETIELEGDFRKYFRLRVPKGFEQEAYQIFTPDVMADLIDKASNLSFEFVGNKLYIYATKVIQKRDELQSMFSLSEYLVTLFEKNTTFIKV